VMFRKRKPWDGVGVFLGSVSLVLGLSSLALSTDNGEKFAVEVKTIQSTSSPQSRQAVLRITCRWKRVKDPSIMLVLQPDSRAKLENPVPIRFQGDIEAVVGTSIGVCEELGVPYRGSVNLLNQKSFDVMAWRNGLGKVGGCVAGNVERSGAKVAAQAAYFVLRRWAIDDSTLQIEPPGEYFRMGGAMQILFRDGGRVVWQTSLIWPAEDRAE
jgi:hypothetical protein